MFCVECGKEGKLYQGLCSECFLTKNVFIKIPKHIDVEVCGNCGARKKGSRWVLGEDEDLIESTIMENAKRHKDVTSYEVHIVPKFENETNVNVSVITHSNVHDLKAHEEHETRLRFKHVICHECSKQHGGYWEAKVQLRGSKRGLSEEDIEKAIELVESMVGVRERKDRLAFITKIERTRNGIDFYLSSKNLGKAISKSFANEFGAGIKESHKLVGRKDGKDVYRTTYAVRVSDLREGDFVQFNGRVLRVLNVSTNKVFLRDIHTWENISFKTGELEKAKLLGGEDIIKEMVVVSKSENEIQVLDPDTLKTVDVLLPKGFEICGESVKVVKCEAGYFLVGE